jgi:intracellular sulfur oxidation DsrE/DsrF family protein
MCLLRVLNRVASLLEVAQLARVRATRRGGARDVDYSGFRDFAFSDSHLPPPSSQRQDPLRIPAQQQELGKENVQLEIIAYGPGINMLKLESEVGGRLAEARDNGVVIIACGNTMKGQKLAPGDMHPAAKIVFAGVVEIMKRQKEGYAHIRP